MPLRKFLSSIRNNTLISIGSCYSLVITKDGSLYTWGDNRYGQLGTGDTTNLLVPTILELD